MWRCSFSQPVNAASRRHITSSSAGVSANGFAGSTVGNTVSVSEYVMPSTTTVPAS